MKVKSKNKDGSVLLQKHRGGRPSRDQAAEKAWNELNKRRETRRGGVDRKEALAVRPPHSPAPVIQEENACT